MELEMKDLFGLPAHPLLVHAVVVLVPLVAIGVILAALWKPARRALAPTILLVALPLLLLVQFATGSGEELEDQVDRTELVRDHASMGDTFLIFAVLLAIGAVIVFAWWRAERRDDPPAWTTRRGTRIGLVAVAIVCALVPTVRVAQVGHSGAKATWDEVDDAGGDRAGDDHAAPDDGSDRDDDD